MPDSREITREKAVEELTNCLRSLIREYPHLFRDRKRALRAAIKHLANCENFDGVRS